MVKAIIWVMNDGTKFLCPILEHECVFCKNKTIVALPPPLSSVQTDGTTHVCHPGIGGCNYGFDMTKSFVKPCELET